MKLREKNRALKLREQGDSITAIASKLKVSKASVSGWVKNVVLSKELLTAIKDRSHSAAAVEKRRYSRLLNENARRQKIIDVAEKQIQNITSHELFLIGVALYWGEGSKKKRGVIEFTNSDPYMIKVMKEFFIKACKVHPNKFRGHVYIHEHLNSKAAEEYWSDVAEIPLKQFHKTSIQQNKNRIQKDTLPFGTFAIVVCNTQLKLSMDGWIKGMFKGINN